MWNEGTATDQELYDLVCQINQDFYNNNNPNTNIHFYVRAIRRNLDHGGSFVTIYDKMVNNSPKIGEVNIYLGAGVGSKYKNEYDIILMDNTLHNQATHELGHMLGLRHTYFSSSDLEASYAGCGHSGCNGDPDCCPDTPNGPSGNWMDPGATTGAFTNAQLYLMAHAAVPGGDTYNGCIPWRPWGAVNPSIPAIAQNIYNIIPTLYFGTYYPDYWGGEGYVGGNKFIFPQNSSGCSYNFPTSARITIYTGCIPPYNISFYWLYDLTQPFNLDSHHGIRKVVFTYFYPGTSATNTSIDYIVNYPMDNTGCGTTEASKNYKTVATKDLDFSVSYSNGKFFYTNFGFDSFCFIDISGKILYRGLLEEGSNKSIEIASELSSGMYLIKVFGKGGEKVFKIIK